ncbi:hypothetical protein MTR67_044061 [Solanum verrucosum]|uniref:Reverse transcriptase domain-containing protein n=1 Tax=Solanum verrucosum TaxID=315347 RepID=A0AAF0USL6_SOLVR|nr:hypothetical protein MTR67_044061 [Solanum verrucosum]
MKDFPKGKQGNGGNKAQSSLAPPADMAAPRGIGTCGGRSGLIHEKERWFLIMCIDYHHLKKAIVKNKYPLPRIHDLFDQIQGATCFSKIDLSSGYHHLKVKESDIPKTTFMTHYGHYEFFVMSFGLINAHGAFMDLINRVFKEFLDMFVIVFIDNILIYSRNEEDHAISCLAKKFKSTLRRLRQCGIDPDPPSPTDIRSLLGLAAYYKRFIDGFSSILSLLTKLTQKKITKFKWSKACEKSFQKLKTRLATTLVLTLPKGTKGFVVYYDASKVGIGCMLLHNGKLIAYVSRSIELYILGVVLSTDMGKRSDNSHSP